MKTCTDLFCTSSLRPVQTFSLHVSSVVSPAGPVAERPCGHTARSSCPDQCMIVVTHFLSKFLQFSKLSGFLPLFQCFLPTQQGLPHLCNGHTRHHWRQLNPTSPVTVPFSCGHLSSPFPQNSHLVSLSEFPALQVSCVQCQQTTEPVDS